MSPTETEVQKSLSFGLKKKLTLDKSGDRTAGFILLQNPASSHLGQKRQCGVLKNTNEV